MTPTEQLYELRREISALDQDLVALFLRRMEICDQVANVKKAGDIAVTDPERDRQVIDQAAALARDPESGAEVAALMQTVLKLSKQRQHKKLPMARERNVILIGMPGCGKTTLGRLLAERLSRPAFDSDAEIERQTGRTVPDIFAKDGEDAFRALETECIASLLERDGIVLSVGGGAVERNAALLRGGGLVVYIERSVPSILRTLEGGRPLLEGDAEARLRELYQRRRGLYETTCHARVRNEAAWEAVLGELAAVTERTEYK